MSPADIKEMAWLLMLVPFAIVLGIGVFFIYCACRRASLGNSGMPANELPASATPSESFRSSPFEQPSRWLAVKASNPAVVQAALHLARPTSCSWEEGLAEAREDKLFISPSISGWVLVVGSGLPEPAEDVDFCYRFLTELSRKLGHIQFFSLSRVVNYHCWALIERGHIYRAYAWAGETLWNQGPVTAAERDLGLVCFGYGSEQNPFAIREVLTVNTDNVNQLAARWSVDPCAYSPAMSQGRGIVGEFSQSKPH
ncbi:MAG TPA: hypothetical protein VH619_13170 [Verrucomicrobiae bacterium]|jgi:hypothetical protein|nr:hypothetical protein [Verrucomicrobiae bacterium]